MRRQFLPGRSTAPQGWLARRAVVARFAATWSSPYHNIEAHRSPDLLRYRPPCPGAQIGTYRAAKHDPGMQLGRRISAHMRCLTRLCRKLLAMGAEPRRDRVAEQPGTFGSRIRYWRRLDWKTKSA